MKKYDIKPQFECQNTIFGPSSNVKIGFFLNVKIRYWPRFQMSKYDIPTQCECQNRILNVKIRYSVPV